MQTRNFMLHYVHIVSKPSDPCKPICNHFHLLYRRDSCVVSFAQAWTMFWGDCHRAQTVQALRRAGAAALARLSRRGPKSNHFPWAMNHDSDLRQLTQYGKAQLPCSLCHAQFV